MIPSWSCEIRSSRSEHSIPFDFDAADDAPLQIKPLPWDMAAHGREDRVHAGARIWCAADHLDGALRRLHVANPQPIGVRCWRATTDAGDRERLQVLSAISHRLDLEPAADEAAQISSSEASVSR